MIIPVRCFTCGKVNQKKNIPIIYINENNKFIIPPLSFNQYTACLTTKIKQVIGNKYEKYLESIKEGSNEA